MIPIKIDDNLGLQIRMNFNCTFKAQNEYSSLSRKDETGDSDS